MERNLVVLTAAQAFAQCGAPIVVLTGGLVGTLLAPSAALATLPVALMIVGTAATTIPAAMIMNRFGRKPGFLLGATYAGCAGLLAILAISLGSFPLFCIATFLIGSHNAFIQQYRFAVAESVPPEKISQSISILLLAGVVAAWMGPEAGERFHDALPAGEFAGSFAALSVFMACAFAMLLFYRPARPAANSVDAPPRPFGVIIRQPRFMLAVSAGAVGYGVMTFIMTATPVAMHEHDHFSLSDTAWVIQSHIMAMYLPSLASGMLIARFGPHRIIVFGLFSLTCCLVVAWIDHTLMHYWWALVLLGVGWNFLFLGGTTLLTGTYRPSERFRVQALNDFMVFGLQAMAALGSGVILAGFGWLAVLALSVPLLVLLAVMLVFTPWNSTLQPEGTP